MSKIVAQDYMIDITCRMDNTRLDKIVLTDINKTGGLHVRNIQRSKDYAKIKH